MAIARPDREAKPPVEIGSRVEVAHCMDDMIKTARHRTCFSCPEIAHETAADSYVWNGPGSRPVDIKTAGLSRRVVPAARSGEPRPINLRECEGASRYGLLLAQERSLRLWLKLSGLSCAIECRFHAFRRERHASQAHAGRIEHGIS